MDKKTEPLERATVRFAGDSGDGMQITGTQFSLTSGTLGNEVNTFPDYPSEIRAPEGTLYGVSAYQLQFASEPIHTFGDKINVLVAMNASSLKVNLPKLKKGGIIIANAAGFDKKNLKLAEYEVNPLENGSLTDYQVVQIDMTEMVKEILSDFELTKKNVERTKNFFALGLTYWLFDRDTEPTINWLKKKFSKKQDIQDANIKVMLEGYNFAKESELFPVQYKIEKAKMKPGVYRNLTGNEACAIGLTVAARKAKLPLFVGSYPITPASEILHFISGYKKYGVKLLQAEDEIGGITSAIGASFAGYFAGTTTSGPGLSLKVESVGLAVILELPLVIIDVQRGGPSTGLPTKPEQSDLLMAMYGRHGEAPVPIVAARSSADCFHQTIEAGRLAVKYMTPVILLTDGYLAQGTSPFRVPTLEELPDIHPNYPEEGEEYLSYKRDKETLARKWAVPGMQGFEHRIGGLEKEDITGNVSQEPLNHQRMVELRRDKIEGIVQDVPLAEIDGDKSGDLLIVGWGGTYGAIKDAVEAARAEGKTVSYCHLTHINPLPKNMREIVDSFDRILIPELNLGHLRHIFESIYLRPMLGLNKVQGLPLKSDEVKNKIDELLSGGN